VRAKDAAAAYLIFLFFGNRQEIARSSEAAAESLGVLLDTCALKAPQLLKDEVAVLLLVRLLLHTLTYAVLTYDV
jgi:hypothetical protein